METLIILGGIVTVIIVSLLILKQNKSKTEVNIPVEESSPNEIDVLPDSPIDDITPSSVPPPEETPRPKPLDCKYGIFPPAPQKYFYTDCCGNKIEGEGYQPWEKRAPVPVNVVYEYEGMEILEGEAYQDCK